MSAKTHVAAPARELVAQHPRAGPGRRDLQSKACNGTDPMEPRLSEAGDLHSGKGGDLLGHEKRRRCTHRTTHPKKALLPDSA
jgi:hypothetical protein